MKNIKLMEPSVKYYSSFINATNNYKDNCEDRYKDLNDISYKKFSLYLDKLKENSIGKNLKPNYVPETTFWLVKEENELDILGFVRIRHYLTKELELEGGHIGYDIVPKFRKQGYGTLILKLAIEKAKAIGINKIVVTCDEDNLGSRKVIESNGGIFEDSFVSRNTGVVERRYGILQQ